MKVIITAVSPDNVGLADPIVHQETTQGANVTETFVPMHPSSILARSLCLVTILGVQIRASCAELNDLDPTLDTTRALIERYTTDRRSLDHVLDIPGSESVRQRHEAFYQDGLRGLGEVDFQQLDQAQRIDYLLFRDLLNAELQELEHDRKRAEEIAALLPFREKLLSLQETRRTMKPIVPREAADVLDNVQREIEDLQKKLEAELKEQPEKKPYKQTLAFRAVRTVEGLRSTLRGWNNYYTGYDPQFSWWVRSPYDVLDQSLENYAKFLRKTVAGIDEKEEDPVVGDPIGREALLDALKHEMIAYTPEELITIAEQEFAWCEKEWRRASAELGYGEDWKRALRHVKELHVAPGEQPALIRQLAIEAVEFLEDRDLVGIPPLCKETWRMEMMSPERQKVTPYFTGGQTISVSFPTDTMTHEQKLMSMRGNNIHFARATVHHELIPGHHLQGYMAARYRTHRAPFRTPFFVEGWALYWEMLLWDLNFPQSAEDRIGMLFWRTHRCARIIFSLSFHLEKMTAAEAIEFLIDRVGHERNNATAEVRRSVNGSYSPVYQAAYMLGGLQIRALHHDLVQSGDWTHRRFHDALLRENSIPIEMIRASLTQQPLTPDYEASWRFYPGFN